MLPRIISEGPTTAGGILLVGESPGADEDRLGRPFVGVSGHELDAELGLAGFNRSNLRLTNVCHERPPSNEIEHFFCLKSLARREGVALLHGRYPHQPVLDGLKQLQVEVDRLQPRLIICLGNTALWAFTGLTGIIKWRGSILPATGGPVEAHGAKLIPTLHPAAVLREYVWRAVVIQDLKRAKRESQFPEIRRPAWSFTVPSSVAEAEDWAASHIFSQPPDHPIVGDVENFYETDRLHAGRLICLGFASSKHEALCIPFTRRVDTKEVGGMHYWASPEDELAVTKLSRLILSNRQIVFHNRLHDCQILARNWGVMPLNGGDTMVAQHVAFPGQLGGKIDPITGRVSKKGSSLSLAFCSSMYCAYHRAWKDDGKGWDPSIDSDLSYYHYNCEDVVRTYEVMEELTLILRQQNLYDQYLFELELFEPVFDMMFRGMNFDEERRRELLRQVSQEAKSAQAWINLALDHPLNVGSMVQMRQLFYSDFQLPPILHRKTKKPTLDDKALETIAKCKPLLGPLIARIQYLRSLGVFKENFLEARTSSGDRRLRTAMNIVGPETFRFSSNITAFGEGGNLQNLPRDS
jgi:uracil-DNA glycosylase